VGLNFFKASGPAFPATFGEPMSAPGRGRFFEPETLHSRFAWLCLRDNRRAQRRSHICTAACFRSTSSCLPRSQARPADEPYPSGRSVRFAMLFSFGSSGSRLASRALLPVATGRLVLRILACRGLRLSCITLQLFELLHLVFCFSRFSLLAVESRQTEMRLRRQRTLVLNR